MPSTPSLRRYEAGRGTSIKCSGLTPSCLTLPCTTSSCQGQALLLNTLTSPGMSSETLIVLPVKWWWLMGLFFCLEIPHFLASALGLLQEGHCR